MSNPPEILPRVILAAISRQCEEQTGTCVMVHDPERGACSPENCFLVRQYTGWGAAGPLRSTSYRLRGEPSPSDYFPGGQKAEEVRIRLDGPVTHLSGLQREQNQVQAEQLRQLVSPPLPNGNKPKLLCRLFGHRWKPCHKMQRNQEEHRFEWVYHDHVCTRCYMSEKRIFPNG